MIRRLLILFIFLWIPGQGLCAPTPEQSVQSVFRLTNQRFVMMHAVAAYKHLNHLPVDITIPERVELRSLFRYMGETRLNVRSARPFVTNSLLIGKNIQLRWMHYWRQAGVRQPTEAKKLDTEIVPLLVDNDKKMVNNMVRGLPYLRNPKNVSAIQKMARQILTAPFLQERDRVVLVNDLLKIRLRSAQY